MCGFTRYFYFINYSMLPRIETLSTKNRFDKALVLNNSIVWGLFPVQKALSYSQVNAFQLQK
jgi:hypothetical protein